jgi:guanylate kinase
MFLRSPDAETLRRRLRGRGTEGAGEIERRMRNAEVELSHEPEFDYSVVNGDGALDEAVVEVVNIIERERITRRGMRPGGG